MGCSNTRQKRSYFRDAFQKNLGSSKKNPNKIWVDQGVKFYNYQFKQFLKDNNIEMYSTYNEEKSVVAERFIKASKNKIFKHMTAVSKNVYFDVLDDIVNRHNNTVQWTIKMKQIDVKSDSYAEYNVGSNEKNPTFQVSDLVRISKYKKFFVKGYTPNWSEEGRRYYRSFEGNINVKVDFSNYATKSDIKNISHVDTSNFALKTNLV